MIKRFNIKSHDFALYVKLSLIKDLRFKRLCAKCKKDDNYRLNKHLEQCDQTLKIKVAQIFPKVAPKVDTVK